eukprot:5354712-Amphidinium_carterae.1
MQSLPDVNAWYSETRTGAPGAKDTQSPIVPRICCWAWLCRACTHAATVHQELLRSTHCAKGWTNEHK